MTLTYTDPALVTAVMTAPVHRTGQTEYLICYDGHRRRVNADNSILYVRVGAGIEYLDGTTEWMLTGGEPPPPVDVSWFVPHTEPVNFTRSAISA